MSNKYVYDITISKRNADTLKVEKSIGTSAIDLDAVVNKFILNLYQFLKDEHKATEEELKRLVEDDDIPF